jgi:phosphate transport system substrate-binding protein
MIKSFKAAIIIGLSSIGVCAQAAEFTGAGATFPYPIYAKWADAYNKETGKKLNYQSIGSGAGIKQIEAGTIDFGATDKPLSSEDLDKNNLFQFPAVIGGIVLAYNLNGIETNKIRLTGEIVGQMFMGKITKWNDAAIKQLNPDIDLPDQNITIVHRSDGSGTTYLFTTYLTQVNKDWQETVGSDTSVSWPTGLGGKGNEGVAGFIKQTPGSIGYVEYAYAKENKMPTTQLQNSDGEWVKPSIDSFKAAAANAEWENAMNFSLSLTNQPGKDSWPIAGATFILVHTKSKDVKSTQAVIEFFNWSFKNGDKLAQEIDYVPLPVNLKKIIRKAWQSYLKNESGQDVCEGQICQ